MKIMGVNTKENSTVEIKVQIEATAFEQALEKAYRKTKGQIALPGFRRGKAPRKMIEHMYGANVFYEDAINEIAPGVFGDAIKEKEIKAVGQPSVDDVDVADDKTLTITFITAVYPEVTLGEYKGLAAEKTVETAKKKDIDAEIDMLQKRNARIQTVERGAKNEDTVVIDFLGKLNGVPFDGGAADGHELTIGSNAFVPGFEEQLVGIKAGDKRDVTITFPTEYAEELAGKEAVFEVTCQEVKERILPELDDEFAKDVSEFDTLEELKKDIKARLTKERTERAENTFKEEILKQAVENMTVTVPDAMVETTLDNMMRDFYYSISNQGMDPEQYLSMMGMDVNGFRMASRESAVARVKTGLLLDAVVLAEEIKTTEEEVEAEYTRMAEQYGQKVAMLKKQIAEDDIAEDLARNKATDLIYASAKVDKPAAKKAAAPKEDKAEEAPAAKKPAAKKPAAKKPAAKKAE